MDIEGAICDECGGRIGPNGCCYTAKKIAEKIELLQAQIDQLQAEHVVIDQARLDAAMAQGMQSQAEQRLADATLLLNNIKECLDDGFHILPDANVHIQINKFFESINATDQT